MSKLSDRTIEVIIAIIALADPEAMIIEEEEILSPEITKYSSLF